MNQNWQFPWYYLADETDLPCLGDFKTLVVSEQPIIVVRGEDQRIRVLFNICRHREVMVCHEEQGNTSRFVCLFHGWVYNTKGNLIGLSSAGEVTRRFSERRGLMSVPRMGIVRGAIFASFNPEGEDLETYLKRTRFFEGRKT